MLPIMIFVFIAGMCFGFWVDERVTRSENVTQVNNGDNWNILIKIILTVVVIDAGAWLLAVK